MRIKKKAVRCTVSSCLRLEMILSRILLWLWLCNDFKAEINVSICSGLKDFLYLYPLTDQITLFWPCEVLNPQQQNSVSSQDDEMQINVLRGGRKTSNEWHSWASSPPADAKDHRINTNIAKSSASVKLAANLAKSDVMEPRRRLFRLCSHLEGGEARITEKNTSGAPSSNDPLIHASKTFVLQTNTAGWQPLVGVRGVPVYVTTHNSFHPSKGPEEFSLSIDKDQHRGKREHLRPGCFLYKFFEAHLDKS